MSEENSSRENRNQGDSQADTNPFAPSAAVSKKEQNLQQKQQGSNPFGSKPQNKNERTLGGTNPFGPAEDKRTLDATNPFGSAEDDTNNGPPKGDEPSPSHNVMLKPSPEDIETEGYRRQEEMNEVGAHSEDQTNNLIQPAKQEITDITREVGADAQVQEGHLEELQEARDKCKQLEDEKLQLKEELVRAKQEVGRAEDRAKELVEALDHSENRITGLQQELRNEAQCRKDAEQRVNELEEEKDVLNGKIEDQSELEQKHQDEMEKWADGAMKEKQKLQDQVTVLQQKLDEVSTSLEESGDLWETSEKRLQDQISALEEAKTKIELEALKAQEESAQKLEDLSTEIAHLKDKHASDNFCLDAKDDEVWDYKKLEDSKVQDCKVDCSTM